MPSKYKKIATGKDLNKEGMIIILVYFGINIIYLVLMAYIILERHLLFHKYLKLFFILTTLFIILNAIFLWYVYQKILAEKRIYKSSFDRALEKIERLTQRVFILEKGKIYNFEAEKGKDKAIELVYFDSATGLPNTLQLDVFLERLLNNEITKISEVALIYLNIKGVDQVQKLISCPVAKMLLKDIGFKIKSWLPPESFIAKMEDFVFAIVFYNYGCSKTLFEYIEKLITLVKGNWYILGQEFYMDVVGGASIYPMDSKSKAEIMEKAQNALNLAQNRLESGIYFFNDKVNLLFQNNLNLEKELRKAVINQEFTLVYHPIIDIEKNRINGAEVLLRWINPQKGLVPASDFIIFATKEGLLPEIEKWVMKRAIEESEVFKNICTEDFITTINFSFLNPLSLEEFLRKEIFAQSDKFQNYIGIEFNQRDIDFNIFSVLKVAEQFRHYGFKLIIDDFYSGCFSIDMLQYLPIDVIKIDKRYIDALMYDTKQQKILKGLIDVAHSLQIKVVAEGIETKSQYYMVRELGCDWIQGYYITKPMDKYDFVDFLKSCHNSLRRLTA